MDLKFSIVEPYWERQQALREQLVSFAEFYGDRDDWELVIVDDGSPTEPARPVVEEFPDLPIRLFEEPMRVPGDGKDPCVPMNRAVREARAEIVILTQADIVHPATVAFHLLEVFEEIRPHGPAVCYPCGMDTTPDTFPWRTTQFTPIPTTDFTMIRKEDYLSVGGFDEWYRDGYACSDSDFMRGLIEAGFKYVCVPNLLVLHRGDLCEQWRDPGRERWTRNITHLYEKRGPKIEHMVYAVPYQRNGMLAPIHLRTAMTDPGLFIGIQR